MYARIEMECLHDVLIYLFRLYCRQTDLPTCPQLQWEICPQSKKFYPPPIISTYPVFIHTYSTPYPLQTQTHTDPTQARPQWLRKVETFLKRMEQEKNRKKKWKRGQRRRIGNCR